LLSASVARLKYLKRAGKKVELLQLFFRQRMPAVTDLRSDGRAAPNEAYPVAGAGSLIPAHKTNIQQRRTYEGQYRMAALSRMHRSRDLYAQLRYEELTGWKSPAAGGPMASTLI
jgi:hypothetical protein